MSKYSIIIVIIAFVFIAVIPVSARDINQGDLVHIGEQNLNLTHALNQARGLSGADLDKTPLYTRIGWWAPGTFIFPHNPSWIIDVTGNYMNFNINPTDFDPFRGQYFAIDDNNRAIGLVFIVEYLPADPPPSVVATPISGPAPLPVQFNDTSTNNDNHGWDWNFGDGATSSLQNPSHTYTISGVFEVTMKRNDLISGIWTWVPGTPAKTIITVFSPQPPATSTPSQTATIPLTTLSTTVTTTITTVPTTSHTTAVTTIPSTRVTTAVTATPTTIPVITTRTPRPTPIVDYDAKIAALEKQVAEQNQKIEEQGNILNQIINFLKSIFGWK